MTRDNGSLGDLPATLRATIAALALPPMPDQSVRARVERKRHREASKVEQDRNIRIVAAGIRKLNTELYGAFGIPDVIVNERAANIVTALMLSKEYAP